MDTPLATYMKRERCTDAQIAAAIGKDRSLVTRLRNGSARPTLDVAAAIERHTGGAVQMQDWVEPTPASPDQQVAA
ncbi:MAG TPA: helix-turn-helix transcriptional regulator [Sphingomonas sp.]|jgi:transcriptional regulator with XRE-family HTH domain